MNTPTFLLCTNPAIGGEFVLHTKSPMCLVKVHTFNTYEDREEWMSKNKLDIGGISLNIPTAYECIHLFEECLDVQKLASLMRRIADWHFAMHHKYFKNK